MHERTCARSGRRQPPVARGNASAAAWHNCSGDIRPTHWRAPAQLRYHHTHGGLTRATLVSGESRLLVRGDFPCTRVLGTTVGSRPPLLRRNANVCRRNCDFCDGRTHMHRSGGRQPPWLAKPHRQGSATFAMQECTVNRSGAQTHSGGCRGVYCGKLPGVEEYFERGCQLSDCEASWRNS